MTLVEKAVSGLQALFAYLHNGNHIIYLINKTTRGTQELEGKE